MTSCSYRDPQTQSRNTERVIKEDFEELHLFLSREEEARIAALREEETQKIRVMQMITKMSRDTFSLSDTVKDIEGTGAENSFIQVLIQTQEKSDSHTVI